MIVSSMSRSGLIFSLRNSKKDNDLLDAGVASAGRSPCTGNALECSRDVPINNPGRHMRTSNLFTRVKSILLTPRAEWQVIAAERDTIGGI